MLYIIAPHVSNPTAVFVLLRRKSCFQPSLHQSLSSLSTYWAGLHLFWTMTKEHRVTAHLLPGVWSSLRVPQGSFPWQEGRFRLEPSDTGFYKGCGHKYGAISLELGTKRLEALANYLQWYVLRAQCSNLIISPLAHVVLVSGDLLVLMEEEKRKMDILWMFSSPQEEVQLYSLFLTSKLWDL